MDVRLALGIEGSQMSIKAIVTIVCIVERLVGGDLEIIETFADLVL